MPRGNSCGCSRISTGFHRHRIFKSFFPFTFGEIRGLLCASLWVNYYVVSSLSTLWCPLLPDVVVLYVVCSMFTSPPKGSIQPPLRDVHHTFIFFWNVQIPSPSVRSSILNDSCCYSKGTKLVLCLRLWRSTPEGAFCAPLPRVPFAW